MLDLGQKAEKQQAGPQTALGWGEMWASASEDSQVLPRDPRDFLEGGVWEVSPERCWESRIQQAQWNPNSIRVH